MGGGRGQVSVGRGGDGAEGCLGALVGSADHGHDVLGGGGMASLRTDNLAKCYAQVLLAMEVPVPDDLSL